MRSISLYVSGTFEKGDKRQKDRRKEGKGGEEQTSKFHGNIGS